VGLRDADLKELYEISWKTGWGRACERFTPRAVACAAAQAAYVGGWGIFDDLDMLFDANQQEAWTSTPLLKAGIRCGLAIGQGAGVPYRLICAARKDPPAADLRNDRQGIGPGDHA